MTEDTAKRLADIEARDTDDLSARLLNVATMGEHALEGDPSVIADAQAMIESLTAQIKAAQERAVALELERDEARAALERAITYVELSADYEGGDEGAEAKHDLALCRKALGGKT